MRNTVCQQLKWLLRLALLIVCVMGAGCTSPTSPAAAAWLQQPSCAPPCWNQLTPGKTTIDDLKRQFAQNPSVTDVYIANTPGGVGNDLEWQYADSQLFVRGDYQTTAGQSVITRLSVNLGQMALRDIIARYGSPSHIMATGSYSPERTRHYLAIFVFLDHGFLVAASLASAKDQLSSNMIVSGIDFFVPSIPGVQTALASNPLSLQALTPWRGFGEFRMYCHAQPGSDICTK